MKQIDYDQKEFKKLEKENDEIRLDISILLNRSHPFYNRIWESICLLIENELAQEQYCNA